MAQLAGIDWVILVGYVFVTLAIGVKFSGRIHTAEDYFLGDRSIPWWALGLSVLATYVGAMTFLGAPAWAYDEGLAILLIHINYPIAIFFVCVVFIPFFYDSGSASIYDYLEKRFGGQTRLLMASVFLFGNLIYSGIMLYTTSLLLSYIAPISVPVAILLVALFALSYTLLGGLNAVVWTDVVQSFVLLLGALSVLFFLLLGFEGNMGSLYGDLQSAGTLDIMKTSLDPEVTATLWTGIVAMSIYHVVVYGVNQMMVQRTLAAKTIGDAKKAFAFMGYAAFFVFLLMFAIGILLGDHYAGQAFDNKNTIILTYIDELAVPGLLGLIAAAVLASAMSSLDSSLNSMATVSTLDFYQRFSKKPCSPEKALVVTRLFTVFWGMAVLVPAFTVLGWGGSVLELLSKIGSFFVGAKLSCYGLGFFSRNANERGILVGVAASFTVLWWVASYTQVAWPWYAVIGGLVSLIVGWLASLALEGRRHEWHPYSVPGRRRMFAERGLPTHESGWSLMPGSVDRALLGLPLFFVVSLGALLVLTTL
ncbi:sodium transporter [Kineobactrum sediminis]|uniref:Sodium transporter n=1 Tax=Kineobactrum sediminis TaxID=1905677 RepID=A0A2N5XZ26_9GAMM|nr:sodium/solute symporter [Kineobactrum sediminis]PLW81404.1 sodium transporter [Kineobactrum sediminis]